jgi:hypothetical protein
MFNLLKGKSAASAEVPFDFAAAKKRCKIIIIDDEMTSPAADALQADGYLITKCYKVDPAVIASCETGTFDIVVLDQPSLGLFDRIRLSNPAQYLVAMGAQPEHPAAAPYFQKANGTLKKPVDAAALKAVLDAGIKALYDVNQLLVRLAGELTKMKVDKALIDALLESLRKNIPQTVGGATKLVKTAIAPAKLTTEITFILWLLVRTRM